VSDDHEKKKEAETQPKRSWEIDWNGAKTLDETVVEMILRGQTKTEEFRSLVRWYKRDRIMKIWESYLEKKKERNHETTEADPAGNGHPKMVWASLEGVIDRRVCVLPDTVQLHSCMGEGIEMVSERWTL
jgi:hypothetical protein